MSSQQSTSLLTEQEWEIYRKLKECWDLYEKLVVYSPHDRIDFGIHLNATVSVIMRRAVEREIIRDGVPTDETLT